LNLQNLSHDLTGKLVWVFLRDQIGTLSSNPPVVGLVVEKCSSSSTTDDIIYTVQVRDEFLIIPSRDLEIIEEWEFES
jgi:hypothetical protein